MVLGGVWGSVPEQHLCLVGPGPSQGRGVHRVSVWIDVSPSAQLSEPAEDALLQLPVPAELAQKVLQALEKRLQGSAQSELRSSRVYAKYLPGSGAEQRGGGSATVSSEGDDPRAVSAEVAKEELSAATAFRSDSQLFCELLEREGLRFPQAAEQSEGEGPTEGGGPGEAAGGCRGCGPISGSCCGCCWRCPGLPPSCSVGRLRGRLPGRGAACGGCDPAW